MKDKIRTIWFSIALGFTLVAAADATERPSMGIVISESAFRQKWDVTQMSGQGWAGIAHLAGIPYDTLFLSDIAEARDLSKYRVLVFAQCAYVEDKLASGLTRALRDYLEAGGNLIIDGPLGVYDENGSRRDHEALDKLLGLEWVGPKGDSNCRIRVATGDHFVTRPFDAGQFLTQHLAKELNILRFVESGEVLLTSTDGKQVFPFLSCRATKNSRTVLLSDLTTFAGATSIFRNDQPQVFYANMLLEAAIRSLYWTIYGDIQGAFPAPQVSNANLTAIVRLDADVSENADYQRQTFDFLMHTARSTGVVPVYAWVSSGATKAGWDALAPLGKRLEALGGKIGSHSKFHRIRDQMPLERWKEELDGSIEEIGSNMSRQGAPLGRIEFFINPGDTIHMNDYEQLARRFIFCMTHGFEQDTPVGYGNLTWFTGPYKDLVVLNNSPSPDYQWFYDPTWSYTTAQITAYQEATFNHMFHGIGRGVIYNQMWHDYSISSMPVRSPRRNAMPAGEKQAERIKNTYNLPMYEAIREKFATFPIYCPEPLDLTHKILASARWNYEWKADKNRIEMTLDLSSPRLQASVPFTGGMGIRMENTTDKIQAVAINGQPHFGFNDHVVILPNLNPGPNSIVVTLGAESPDTARLTYISKRMPSIRRRGDKLEVEVVTKSRARFAFQLPRPAVLLNADGQDWDRKGDHQLTGYVDSDRTLVLMPASRNGFAIAYASLPITAMKESTASVSLALDSRGEEEAILRFRCAKTPQQISWGTQLLQPSRKGQDYDLRLPAFSGRKELHIRF